MKFMSIVYPLIIVMDILVFVNFLSWNDQCVTDYQQRQLDMQVNYACDAAAQMMLQRTKHIQTDYADWGNMKVDPEIALSVYKEVLLRNFGWGVSDVNKDMLEAAYIPFFCVAGYDGYYMYERVRTIDEYEIKDESGNIVDKVKFWDLPLVWTPKLPYSRYDEASQSYYAYNLNYGKCVRYLDGKIEVNYMGEIDEDISDPTKSHPKLAVQKGTVSKLLSDACTNALKIGLYGEDVDYIYIPSQLGSFIETNPIEGPTVITWINNDYARLDSGSGVFGIGGTKIDDNQYCIAYTYNGHKFYTYAYNRDRDEFKSTYPSIKIEKIFTNPKAAAKDGYYFDLSFVKGSD